MSQVYIPKTMEEACQMLSVANRVAVAGATNLYVDRYDGRELEKDMVSLHKLKDLKTISHDKEGWHIGTLCTFDQIEQFFLRDHADIPESMKALGHAASFVGGPQVRNRGTIGGNIISASPSADSVPVLMALDAQLSLFSTEGTRQVPIDAFMKGVKKTDLAPNELLTEILIPDHPGHALFEKVGTRNALAIAVCNLCVYMEISKKKIKQLAIAIGSCAPTCVRARATEEALSALSKPSNVEEWNQVRRIIVETLPESISPIDDIRAKKSYREKVAANLTYKLVKELWEGES